MSDIVQMYREGTQGGGRNRFSCPVAVWELLQELGRTFGWKPKGTTYIVPLRLKIEAPAQQNYQPGNALDYKRVTAEDAAGWASALGLAKDSPHFAAMIEARAAAMAKRGEAVGKLLPGALEEFITFASAGGFSFAVEADAEKQFRAQSGMDADQRRDIS